jgi:hypothetical protein
MFALVAPPLLTRPIDWTAVCRRGARVMAFVLMSGWLVAAVAELFHPDFYVPRLLLLQGAALAVVFASYVIGWRWELAGGLLALAGTAALFVVIKVSLGVPPQLGMALFAMPGLLYLEAWQRDRHEMMTAEE